MAKILAKRSEAALPAWVRGMNEEQLDAINHNEGPLLLLAAAGSGKTRAVVHRILRLVIEGVAEARRICAVTFSKKAADEMNARLKTLGCSGARVGTWHSLCLQILMDDGTPWSQWQVEGDDKRKKGSRSFSTKAILKEVLGFRNMNWKNSDPNKVTSFIGLCKANLFAPDSEGAMKLALKKFGSWEAKRALEAFFKFNEALREKQILTFDDFLVFVAEYLSTNEEARARWASKFDFLIQDEAQDMNLAQKTIAWLLARDHRNYMVVGDVFQSIYSFRGSMPEYLANFEQEWPGAKVVWLGRNYRSGDSIILAANNIIRSARVAGYEPRDMVPSRGIEGSTKIVASEDLDAEADAFGIWIENIVHNGGRYSDITALFRTNAQSRALEEAMLRRKIPYVVVGGTSFYERSEVRALLAYLRVAAGKGELEDIKRSINAPFRYLGAAFVDRVMQAAEESEKPDWTEIVERVSRGVGIQGRQRHSVDVWVELIEGMRARIEAGLAPGATEDDKARAQPYVILEDLIRATDFIEYLTKEEGEDSIESSSASNVRELSRLAQSFSSVGALLDYITKTIRAARAQRDDKQAGGQRVLLMNIHRSKGLEWPHVWISGMNEFFLPHPKGDEEEERRLAYVAATRARDTLVLSYVRTLATRAGITNSEPSRFLFDCDLPMNDDDEEIAAVSIAAQAVVEESLATE